MKKVALVTGAEGFIGSHLVKFLQEKDWSVVGTYLRRIDRMGEGLPGLRFASCDLRDPGQVERVLGEHSPTHIFHLGAQSLPSVSWSNPVLTFESNVMGSLYLFEAIRKSKRAPVIVCACSSAEYGNVPATAVPVREDWPPSPLSPYGISKLCVDLLAREYCQDHNIPAVTLRLFNTTGPGKTNDAPSDFIRQMVRIKKGLQPPVVEVGNLTTSRAFLDVEDAVHSFHAAALKGKRGEVYNVCAATTCTIGEILNMSMRLAGVKPEVRCTSRLLRPSDEKIIFGNTEKFRRDTGWNAMIPIEQTLASMVAYWEDRENHAVE